MPRNGFRTHPGVRVRDVVDGVSTAVDRGLIDEEVVEGVSGGERFTDQRDLGGFGAGVGDPFVAVDLVCRHRPVIVNERRVRLRGNPRLVQVPPPTVVLPQFPVAD